MAPPVDQTTLQNACDTLVTTFSSTNPPAAQLFRSHITKIIESISEVKKAYAFLLRDTHIAGAFRVLRSQTRAACDMAKYELGKAANVDNLQGVLDQLMRCQMLFEASKFWFISSVRHGSGDTRAIKVLLDYCESDMAKLTAATQSQLDQLDALSLCVSATLIEYNSTMSGCGGGDDGVVKKGRDGFRCVQESIVERMEGARRRCGELERGGKLVGIVRGWLEWCENIVMGYKESGDVTLQKEERVTLEADLKKMIVKCCYRSLAAYEEHLSLIAKSITSREHELAFFRERGLSEDERNARAEIERQYRRYTKMAFQRRIVSEVLVMNRTEGSASQIIPRTTESYFLIELEQRERCRKNEELKHTEEYQRVAKRLETANQSVEKRLKLTSESGGSGSGSASASASASGRGDASESERENGNGNGQLGEELLDLLRDPFSHHIMIDPVIASDGHTYERLVVELLMNRSNVSPMTHLEWPNRELQPNLLVQRLLDRLRGLSRD